MRALIMAFTSVDLPAFTRPATATKMGLSSSSRSLSTLSRPDGPTIVSTLLSRSEAATLRDGRSAGCRDVVTQSLLPTGPCMSEMPETRQKFPVHVAWPGNIPAAAPL